MKKFAVVCCHSTKQYAIYEYTPDEMWILKEYRGNWVKAAAAQLMKECVSSIYYKISFFDSIDGARAELLIHCL